MLGTEGIGYLYDNENTVESETVGIGIIDYGVDGLGNIPRFV